MVTPENRQTKKRCQCARDLWLLINKSNQDLYLFQKFGTKSGKPTEKVVIASCGELTDKHIMSQKEQLKLMSYREGQGEKLV